MIEVKGDDRTNDDSKTKLKLGSKWADKAGDKIFILWYLKIVKLKALC